MSMAFTVGAAGAGTDIEQYCSSVTVLPEQMGTFRGSNLILPGFDGEYDLPDRPTASYDLVLNTMILDTPSFFENKEAIAKLLFARVLPYLGRTIPTTVPRDVEIPVRPTGLPMTGSTSPRFLVRWPLRTIDPYWRDQTQRTGVNPISSIVIGGDAPVTDAVITFTGGTTPVLENTTNGDKLTLLASPGGTPVIVDMGQIRSITRGGSNWDANFDPNRQRWMRFESGTNAMTLSGGGSVSVDLHEKYR